VTLNKPSILIVDDDAEMRRTLSSTLRTKGYQPFAAKTGVKGLSLIGQNEFNVAIIDLQLPDISGLEVLDRVKTVSPFTEIVILTGHATLASAVKATNNGVFSYLQKPCQIEQLLLHIRRAIERQRSEKMIRHIAYYDPLTELPNRMLFNERLQQAISEAHRHDQSIAIMLLDLDRFQVINDTYEHETGDRLIQVVAQRLKSIVRECDTVARLGGDEFLLIFPFLKSAQEATDLARRITKLFNESFVLESCEIYITASIGISIYPTDGVDPPTLIKNADGSMYFAKGQGGNTFQFYSPALDFKRLTQLTLGNSLRKALAQNDLLLHYQPQIDLSSGKIFGAEALVRWQHREWGLIPPEEFVALAEDIGLIIPIGKVIMQQAFSQMKMWRDDGLKLDQIAVNLSVMQFKGKNLIATISKLLKACGVDPALLELEITESIIMQNPEETIATIRKLRSLGISFAIDDFGTGYSSLKYLKYLPAGRLKIAKCFIDGILTDSNDRTIVKTIINLAHNLGMRVIAEGVETVEQLEFLRCHGCDEVQGFLFSRPLPADELKRLCEEEYTQFYNCGPERSEA
jgi:diguanylate cyclase (GGDEF)-like protein